MSLRERGRLSPLDRFFSKLDISMVLFSGIENDYSSALDAGGSTFDPGVRPFSRIDIFDVDVVRRSS